MAKFEMDYLFQVIGEKEVEQRLLGKELQEALNRLKKQEEENHLLGQQLQELAKQLQSQKKEEAPKEEAPVETPSKTNEERVMGHVLIVDDEAAVRSTLRAVLESQGYTCDEAEDGAVALAYLEKQHCDLVITDNRMPTLSGLDFLRRLAAKPDPKPPVIFFTGDISETEMDAAIKSGARAVLQKPPNFGEIVSAVQQALSN